MEGRVLKEDVIARLSEQWDRMVWADNEDYRTTEWEYMQMPLIVCYHVATLRFRIFVKSEYRRLDLTSVLADDVLVACERMVSNHFQACEEEW